MEPNCSNCPFSGQKKVYGEGYKVEGSKVYLSDDETFNVVLVAMAPARVELVEGHPLVGESGQHLRRVLHQLGVDKYYATNVLLCQITSDLGEIIKAAAECCKERLLEEIRSKHPKLVIALGDLPLRTLTDLDYKITEAVGRLFPSEVGPLMPALHPAYYLRRPEDAMDFTECMRAGVRMLSGTYQQAGPVEYTLVTGDNAASILEELNHHEYISVDLETSGYSAVKLHPDYILEMGLAASSDHAYIVPGPEVYRFKDLLETKKCIGWNIKFDALFLKAVGIDLNIYFDGLLAHYRLDERPHGHGLKRVAQIYLGAADWEADIKRYLPHPKTDSYAIIPKDVLRTYCSKDVCYTYQLWQLLGPEMKDDWVFWNVLMPATRMFVEVEWHGIKVDPDKILNMHTYLTEELNNLGQEVYTLAGRAFNMGSPAQVAEVLYDDFRVPMSLRYGRSTNKDLLEEYRDAYPIVDKILSWREAAKMEGTYIQGLVKNLDNDFRIHPSYKLFGAVTGRLSSEDPSIMNVKRDSKLKEIYLPEPGQLMANFDFKQMELRWYCIYAHDEVLREILMQEPTPEEPHRGDPHYAIGAIAFGPGRAMELRVAAKEVVFGVLYLRSLASLEREYGREVAAELKKAMNELIPKHKEYTENVLEQVRTLGYVESWFKRRRNFPLITSANRHKVEKQAVNMPMQSAASDLNLLAGMLHLWSIKDKYNIRPHFCVHDSSVISIPNKEVVPMLRKEIEDKAYEIVKGAMPFTVDVKVGPNWGTVK